MNPRLRIQAIRLMEKMEQFQNSNERVQKSEDGTLKYLDDKGNVLIEAKMVSKRKES